MKVEFDIREHELYSWFANSLRSFSDNALMNMQLNIQKELYARETAETLENNGDI